MFWMKYMVKGMAKKMIGVEGQSVLVVPLLVVPLPEVVPEVPVLPDGRVAGVVVEPVPLGLVLVEPDVPELITLLVAL